MVRSLPKESLKTFYKVDEVTLEIAKVIIKDSVKLYKGKRHIHETSLNFLVVPARVYHYHNALNLLKLKDRYNSVHKTVWFKLAFDFHVYYLSDFLIESLTTDEDICEMILESWISIAYFFDEEIEKQNDLENYIKHILIELSVLHRRIIYNETDLKYDVSKILDKQTASILSKHFDLQQIIKFFYHFSKSCKSLNTITHI